MEYNEPVMASNKAIDRYMQALVSPDRNIRRKAIIGLVDTGNLRAIPILEKVAAEDSDAELQFLAKKGLSLIKAKLEFGRFLTDAPTGDESAKPTADLNALRTHLDNTDAQKRARVVKASVATRDKRILEVLIPHLEKENENSVKSLIFLAVGILGDKKDLTVLTTNLKAQDPQLRKASVEALGAMNKPFAFPFLVEALNDKDAGVRNSSFALLRRLGKVNILKLLQTMLTSPKGWMKASALRACGRFNSDEVVQMIEPHINAGDESHQRLAQRALKMLARAGNERANSLFRKLSPQEPKAVEVPTAETTEADGVATAPTEPGPDDSVVGEPAPFDLSPAAVDLASSDPRKRHKFLQDAILHNDASVIPDIIKRLPAEPDAKVRASMIITLGRLGGEDELDIIVPFLEDQEDRLRASAVEAISRFENADLEKLLVPRLADKDNRTRANAIVALKDNENVDLISPLKELAESVRIRDRLSAIYAVTHLETDEAIEVLNSLVNDPSRVVAKRADEATQILAGKKKPGELTGKVKPRRRPRKAKAEAPKEEKAEEPEDTKEEEPPKEEPKEPAKEEKEPPKTEKSQETKEPEEQSKLEKRRTREKSTEKETPKKRDRKGRRDKDKKTTEKAKPSAGGDSIGGIPRGIALHAASDLILALGLGGLGLMLLINEGPPIEEALIPFCLIFLVTPGVFLVGGMGLLMGKAWGRHINGCILHILPVPFIAPTLLSYLIKKDSLEFLGMEKPTFPVKLYYGVAVGGVLMMLLLLSLLS